MSRTFLAFALALLFGPVGAARAADDVAALGLAVALKADQANAGFVGEGRAHAGAHQRPRGGHQAEDVHRDLGGDHRW